MPTNSKLNSRLFNDPIYGFITIPSGIIYEIIEHPYYQRLRRINQLGLTNLVYSGAHHTRFHHAIGAMHLMQQAIDTLRMKKNEVTEEEEQGALIAILLHDIGHGPFSHALEHSLVNGISHEVISSIFMDELNEKFDGKLSTAIAIFNNDYPKKFLHQLVSSQLDVDRLDYLKRDCFFTGVEDGEISVDRIIKTLNVKDDKICVEAKGIYSVENFIVARMAMYWQVYLHKTVLSAEFTLVKILKRAKELAEKGVDLHCTPALHKFIYNNYTAADFKEKEVLDAFAQLDDFDVMAAIKTWTNHSDSTLKRLCLMLINRKLLKVDIQNKPFTEKELEEKRITTEQNLKNSGEQLDYFFFTEALSNSAYNVQSEQINILFKDGTVKDIVNSGYLLNISTLQKTLTRYFVCYLK